MIVSFWKRKPAAFFFWASTCTYASTFCDSMIVFVSLSAEGRLRSLIVNSLELEIFYLFLLH